MNDRIYYRVSATSPVMTIIKEAERLQRHFSKAAHHFRKEAGATVAWFSEGFHLFVSSLTFPATLPEGWRQKAPDRAVPDRRTRAGREIAKRLDALPRGVTAYSFSEMLNHRFPGDYDYHGPDRQWHFTTSERYGSVYVLSVPLHCKAKPPGCTELKMSEYWTIREGKQRHEPKRARARRRV